MSLGPSGVAKLYGSTNKIRHFQAQNKVKVICHEDEEIDSNF